MVRRVLRMVGRKLRMARKRVAHGSIDHQQHDKPLHPTCAAPYMMLTAYPTVNLASELAHLNPAPPHLFLPALPLSPPPLLSPSSSPSLSPPLSLSSPFPPSPPSFPSTAYTRANALPAQDCRLWPREILQRPFGAAHEKGAARMHRLQRSCSLASEQGREREREKVRGREREREGGRGRERERERESTSKWESAEQERHTRTLSLTHWNWTQAGDHAVVPASGSAFRVRQIRCTRYMRVARTREYMLLCSCAMLV